MKRNTKLALALTLTLVGTAQADTIPVPDLDAPGVLAYGFDYTPGGTATNEQVDTSDAGVAQVAASSATGKYTASAAMVGGLNLPELKVYAEANGNPARTRTSASAQAWQHYTYTGSTDMTYTMHVTLDGIFDGTNGGVRSWIDAYVESLDANGELSVDAYPSYVSLLFGAEDVDGDVPFHYNLSDDLTFTLTSGGGVSLWAGLVAEAIPGLYGYSIQDVSHTFTVEFTSGDTSLLQSQVSGDTNVSTVPLPAAAWLFGSSLLGLLGFRRSRTAG